MEIQKAIELLKKGEVVALPTETVYGLAADAANDVAVAKIYALKKRPSFNPLIIHVHDFTAAQRIGEFSPVAKEYAERYWPGPLTIVVKKKDKNFAQLATAGLDTVAIRVPSHPIIREVLRSNIPLAAPSANISGSLSPTRVEHVSKEFPDIYLLDGGQCEIGLESTIITFDAEDKVVILREGVIQVNGIRANSGDKIVAPGMLLKHYAPKNKIRINVEFPQVGETFIGFGRMECDYNLSAESDLVEAAANLFSMLHAADELKKSIAVAVIPNEGVGYAINDKLRRATN